MFKIKNRSLIRQIQECCKAKNIEFSLTKVKEHSNNIWNNKVNILAKKELYLDKCIEAEDINIDNLRVLLI